MLFESIILSCLKNIKEERTISSIYHLLKGKKGIQTLQDAYLYRLENYFGIYPLLQRGSFDRKIRELEEQQFIQRMESSSYCQLTEKAMNYLDEHKQTYTFYGKKYGYGANIFYDRLLLLIQTLTNSKMGNFTFLPIVDDRKVQYWMKQTYRKISGDEKNWLEGLYRELREVLLLFSDRDKEIFVHRLTGFKRYGLSLEQLAERFQLHRDDVFLILESMKHNMYVKVMTEKDSFPILFFISKNDSPQVSLTESGKITYRLLKKGYSIEQIASIRNLKINTIYDHIVEIAISIPGFSIQPFVSEDIQREIYEAMKGRKSFKLKDIKQAVSDDITYFQIRLVLSIQNK